MSSYCEYAKGHELHGPYHDNEYGFPIEDESELFERLLLEINQAGLNWELILKKREGFREAYDGFDVDIVADYSEQDRERLLADVRIIRNKLKVNAAVDTVYLVNVAQRVGAEAVLDNGAACRADAHCQVNMQVVVIKIVEAVHRARKIDLIVTI